MQKRLMILAITMLLINSAVFGQGFLDIFSGDSEKNNYKVKFIDGDNDAEEELLLIKIRGVIQEKSDQDQVPFQIEKNLMESIKKDIKLARKRDAIKGILLDINSPGGEVTASDIIYHQIKHLKEETEKPVIAIIGSMGASGAYYVACAADHIIAHPTSIVGSIGVLMQSVNVKEMMKKIGIKPVLLKSKKTPKKDILSPFKEMSESEKKMLLEIINSIYDRFVKIVADSRKMRNKDVEEIADGGIYTAEKAKELNLIDQIGYRENAIKVACDFLDLESIALVKRYKKKSFSEILSEISSMHSPYPAMINQIKTSIEETAVPEIMLKLHLPH
ncbi:MAG: signal peptide peptidase SppA [Candidatus Rifleibacteriota bacterium]